MTSKRRTTGRKRWKLSSASIPRIILLDIGLPKMNGYEVCQAIRHSSSKRRPLVIALTGWGQENDRQKSVQAGFDGHLVKPVDFQALAKLLT